MVPADSFCGCADAKPRKTPIWFALNEERPLFIEGDHQLFGFLTTDANAIVAPIHLKAHARDPDDARSRLRLDRSLHDADDNQSRQPSRVEASRS
jgi:hypothetical protein